VPTYLAVYSLVYICKRAIACAKTIKFCPQSRDESNLYWNVLSSFSSLSGQAPSYLADNIAYCIHSGVFRNVGEIVWRGDVDGEARRRVAPQRRGVEVCMGRGAVVAPPQYGGLGICPRKIFKKINVEIAYFGAFLQAEMVFSALSAFCRPCRQGRIRQYRHSEMVRQFASRIDMQPSIQALCIVCEILQRSKTMTEAMSVT